MLLLVYIFFLAIQRLSVVRIVFRESVDVVSSAIDDLYTHFDVLLNAVLPVVLHVLTELAVNLHTVHDLVENLDRVGGLTVQLFDLKLSQQVSERLESLKGDALSMLAEVNHDLMALGDTQAVFIHRSVLAFLLSHFHPGVSNKAQEVPLEEVSHVVADVIGFKVLLDTTLLGAVVVLKWGRGMDVLWRDEIEETLFPHD